jgi:hypothetical protein
LGKAPGTNTHKMGRIPKIAESKSKERTYVIKNGRAKVVNPDLIDFPLETVPEPDSSPAAQNPQSEEEDEITEFNRIYGITSETKLTTDEDDLLSDDILDDVIFKNDPPLSSTQDLDTDLDSIEPTIGALVNVSINDDGTPMEEDPEANEST